MIWSVVVAVLLAATPAWAQVVSDVGATATQIQNVSVANATSGNLTVSSQSNYLLVVWVILSGVSQSVTAVAWDPSGGNQAFTFDSALNAPGSATRLERWILKAPVAGTKPVKVTLSAANAAWDFTVTGFYNVNQVNPTGGEVTNTSPTTNPLTVTLTTTAGDMGVAASASATGTPTGVDGTADWFDNAGGTTTEGNHALANSTSVTLTNGYDTAAQREMVGVVIKQARLLNYSGTSQPLILQGGTLVLE